MFFPDLANPCRSHCEGFWNITTQRFFFFLHCDQQLGAALSGPLLGIVFSTCCRGGKRETVRALKKTARQLQSADCAAFNNVNNFVSVRQLCYLSFYCNAITVRRCLSRQKPLFGQMCLFCTEHYNSAYVSGFSLSFLLRFVLLLARLWFVGHFIEAIRCS